MATLNARQKYDEQMRQCGYCRRMHEREGKIVWCKRHVPRVTITHHRYRIVDNTAIEVPTKEPVVIAGYKSYDAAEKELNRLEIEKKPLQIQLDGVQERIWQIEAEMERYDEEQRARDE